MERSDLVPPTVRNHELQTSFTPNSLTDIVISHGAFLTFSSLLTLSYVPTCLLGHIS